MPDDLKLPEVGSRKLWLELEDLVPNPWPIADGCEPEGKYGELLRACVLDPR